jgi:hypothetical protein
MRPPSVAVVVLNWLFSTQILPRLDSSYLASALYGATRLDAVRGAWAIIAALAVHGRIEFGIVIQLGHFSRVNHLQAVRRHRTFDQQQWDPSGTPRLTPRGTFRRLERITAYRRVTCPR